MMEGEEAISASPLEGEAGTVGREHETPGLSGDEHFLHTFLCPSCMAPVAGEQESSEADSSGSTSMGLVGL